jgi:copper(I)-binding protein
MNTNRLPSAHVRTRRIPRAGLLLAALLAGLASAACARAPDPQATATAKDASACLPQVHDGWIRLTPGPMAMHAGFARIANPCTAPAAITGADSASYGSISVHETTLDNGVSRMRAVPVLRIPAQGETVLRPGGLHLMLMQPHGSLAPGGTVEIAFRLEDGRAVRATFEVRPASAL